MAPLSPFPPLMLNATFTICSKRNCLRMSFITHLNGDASLSFHLIK